MADIIVHIPLAEGLACGTRSFTAMVNTDHHLCERCYRALETKLRKAIKEQVRAGGVVSDPEGLIERYLGKEKSESEE